LSAKNKVIAGDYLNALIACVAGKVYMNRRYATNYVFEESSTSGFQIDKNTTETYEVIDERTYKSTSSAILRGIVGTTLFGGVGLLAGLSAKPKGIYILAIKFKDGKQSLIEVDEKVYKCII
jgi:hypothetical protein